MGTLVVKGGCGRREKVFRKGLQQRNVRVAADPGHHFGCVPGEGEHKIMDYIRRQRVNPGHDPNTNMLFTVSYVSFWFSFAESETHVGCGPHHARPCHL
jgi:hypothetical protein